MHPNAPAELLWLQRVANAFATCFGLGYIKTRGGRPFGGTTASALGVVAIVLLANLTAFTTASVWYFGALALMIAIGIPACHFCLKKGESDPRRAVIDELAGVWLTFAFLPLGNAWYVDILVALAVFVTFRVLDMRKPLGVRYVERLPGGFGIMLDDLAAGVLGAVLLNLLGWLLSLVF